MDGWDGQSLVYLYNYYILPHDVYYLREFEAYELVARDNLHNGRIVAGVVAIISFRGGAISGITAARGVAPISEQGCRLISPGC